MLNKDKDKGRPSNHNNMAELKEVGLSETKKVSADNEDNKSGSQKEVGNVDKQTPPASNSTPGANTQNTTATTANSDVNEKGTSAGSTNKDMASANTDSGNRRSGCASTGKSQLNMTTEEENKKVDTTKTAITSSLAKKNGATESTTPDSGTSSKTSTSVESTPKGNGTKEENASTGVETAGKAGNAPVTPTGKENPPKGNASSKVAPNDKTPQDNGSNDTTSKGGSAPGSGGAKHVAGSDVKGNAGSIDTPKSNAAKGSEPKSPEAKPSSADSNKNTPSVQQGSAVAGNSATTAACSAHKDSADKDSALGQNKDKGVKKIDDLRTLITPLHDETRRRTQARSFLRRISVGFYCYVLNRVPTAQGKQGKWQKISLSGKIQGIWKFCQNTGKTQHLVCSGCKFPDSKGKRYFKICRENLPRNFEAW